MKLRWRLSKPPENQKQQDMNTGFTIDERTKKVIKSGLVWLGAFTAYRLYKLYEVSESVIYKPVGLSFIRGTNLNDFVVRVKMEILNPEKTITRTMMNSLPSMKAEGLSANSSSVIKEA